MSIVRVSEEGLRKRRETISRLKDEIRHREELAKQKDSPLWKLLGPGIKASIEANREAIEEILASGSQRKNEDGTWETVDPMADFAVLKSLGGAVRAWKHILESVEVEDVIEQKRSYLQKVIEELHEIEKEQGI